MKIRQGFVSNSSTSSFVLLGVVLPKSRLTKTAFCQAMGEPIADDDDAWDAIYKIEGKHNIRFADHTDAGAPNGKAMVGYLVAEWSDEGSGDSESNEPMDQLLGKIEGVLGKFPDLTPDERRIRLITGTRMS